MTCQDKLSTSLYAQFGYINGEYSPNLRSMMEHSRIMGKMPNGGEAHNALNIAFNAFCSNYPDKKHISSVVADLVKDFSESFDALVYQTNADKPALVTYHRAWVAYFNLLAVLGVSPWGVLMTVEKPKVIEGFMMVPQACQLLPFLAAPKGRLAAAQRRDCLAALLCALCELGDALYDVHRNAGMDNCDNFTWGAVVVHTLKVKFSIFASKYFVENAAETYARARATVPAVAPTAQPAEWNDVYNVLLDPHRKECCGKCNPEKEQPEGLSKYHRQAPAEWIDVYDVLDMFDVTNSATAHAVKKLLMPGQRGHKNIVQDLKEARASLDRAIKMEKRKLNKKVGAMAEGAGVSGDTPVTTEDIMYGVIPTQE